MSNRKTTLKKQGWIRLYIKQYRGALVLAIALSVLAYLFASALMFTSGYMISLAAALPLTVLALHVPSIFVRIFGLGKPFLRYSERLVSHNWVLRMTSHMRVRLYNALASRTSALASQVRLGDLLDLLTDDIGHAQDLFLRGILPLASSLIMALVFVLALGAFSLQLCLLMALLLAVVVIVLPLLSALINGARMARMKQMKASLYQELSDDIYGVADWMLAGREQEFIQKTMSMSSELDNVDAQVRRYSRTSDLISQIVFCAAIVTLLVWTSFIFSSIEPAAGISGVAAALADVGDPNAPAYAPNWIAAFVLCFFPLIEAFMPTSHAALNFDSQRKALRRLDEFSVEAPQQEKAGSLLPTEFALSLDNVSFGYVNNEQSAVRDINLNIPEGMVVAILGRSGVGKTTLASLIHGDIIPSAGAVTIGGVDAADLKTVMPHLVGIIRQDPFLFNLTLRDNLKLARPTATDQQLREVLEKVGLAALYESLPQGLDTVIQMDGFNFSGGERQRIALARILLADQPIVILDEPFVGIDKETERLIVLTMLKELAGKTIIVITHHLQNIELFGRVIFLEQASYEDSGTHEASIAFEGSPDELAQTNELFQKLLQMDR